jgi:hypothetical protein
MKTVAAPNSFSKEFLPETIVQKYKQYKNKFVR